MSQIRLNKTPKLEEVLEFLKSTYPILSEAEIIKVALAEKYKKEVGELPLVNQETENLIAKGMEDYINNRYIEVKTDNELDAYVKSL